MKCSVLVDVGFEIDSQAVTLLRKQKSTSEIPRVDGSHRGRQNGYTHLFVFSPRLTLNTMSKTMFLYLL